MISAINLSKSYGLVKVLDNISVDLEFGKINSIVGKSGAGKSTLLHILGTLDLPDTGELVFDNQNISNWNEKNLAEFRNKNVGFVFQFHHLLPEFSAIENVMIPGLIGGFPESSVYTKAKELLDYLGLQNRIQHKPSALSGGEQQRVAVARALINNPKVVFADEPSGNLDTDSSKDLHNLFLKLKKERSQTFVIVTHNQELALMSDRVLSMSDGKIMSDLRRDH